jgi:putative restriction endonuclease
LIVVATDLDWELRLAAFGRLEQLKRAGGGVVSDADLDSGFEFGGETIKFWNRQRGIWRPKQLAPNGSALSITTTPPRPGKKPPYDDQVASDADWFIYRYEGTDPQIWTNLAVRTAMEQRRPIIYFYGITPGVYDAVFPCYVVADHPDELAFEVAADVEHVRLDRATAGAPADAARRRYGTATVKTRLHQRQFRELVVAAYQRRCAVCHLGHPELLDAAHILPDRDERGRPEVPNGLSLCKLHHGAYDADILGVDPEYRVHIRIDVLEEEDGPMLLHGLQELHNGLIGLPRASAHRPNREYLAERFAHFRAA